MYQSLSKRKILSVCIAASLLSHIISLLFIQTHSFWTSNPRSSQTPSPALALIDKVESDKILREIFQEGFVEEGKESFSQEPQPESSAISFMPLVIQPIERPPIPIPSKEPSIDLKEDFSIKSPLSSFTLPPIEPLNLFEHLPKDLIVPSSSLGDAFQRTPSFLPKASITFVGAPAPKKADPSPVRYSTSLLTPPINESNPSYQTTPSFLFADLPEFPTLDDLETSSYSDFFDTEIVFSPMENGEGYVFALTLVPQPGLNLPKIRQHYSFLIDRSNSIQKERLSAVKNALLLALEELDLEDSFNIIAFDSKIEKLSPAPLPATSASIRAAKNFLEQVQLGSFFSTANLTKPLLLTIPGASQDDGLHTAILFSDGESLSKKTAQRELALDWTRYNNGRVSLFAIGVGGDPHLATLDAAAAFNRGKVLFPPTKRGIKRKLLKLMKSIGTPIAKNIMATAIPRSSQTKISLYPKPHQMPSLYLNEPYVILGTIDKLDNFILFIQGKLKNRWLNIKKTISFVNAKRGDASLKAEWALQQAYSLYEQYIYDLNPDHIAEAQALLQPHDLETAFK